MAFCVSSDSVPFSDPFSFSVTLVEFAATFTSLAGRERAGVEVDVARVFAGVMGRELAVVVVALLGERKVEAIGQSCC